MADIFELFRKIERGAPERSAPPAFLVVGLGNPGAEYRDTRHNAGFWAIDRIAERVGIAVDRARHHALVGQGELAGVRVMLQKPTTFMNLSGVAVAEAAAFYKIPPGRVIVLCDDVSFAPGRFRIRRAGSAGGHNGLKSIIEKLGSQEFPRIKIGVGEKPSREYPLADWVLGRPSREERAAIDARLDDVFEALSLMLGGRIEDAMSRYSR